MIIDFNAYLGHWPFRRLPFETADQVVKIMDEQGIDVAVVSSLDSVLYSDVHEGNLDLIEQVKSFGQRFVPFAVLNPKYPGWDDDFSECAQMGFKGLRLYPQYHNYSLTDDECVKLVSRASEEGWVVSVPVRLRDGRGRHWIDTAQDLDLAEVEGLARTKSDCRIVLLESRGVADSSVTKCENVWFEMSRMLSVIKDIEKLLRSVGESRVVFGSGMPLKYVTPAMLKVRNLRQPDAVKERILWRNACDLLGLNVGPG